MAVFDDARACLGESDRDRVDACLAGWSRDSEWRCVADNLRGECALALEDFAALLGGLAERLASGDPQGRLDADAWRALWEGACKPFELRGLPVADEHRPATLGRAWAVGSLARSMTRATGLPEAAARRLLDRDLGRAPSPPRLRRGLEVTPLGGALIWATLDPDDAARDPFDRLPRTAAAVRCALGLGCHPAGEAIVALTYTSAPPAHGLPLHRPTVADANSYSYYRPFADPTAPWGFTAPLDPNPEGLLGMPEVVHGQVKGAALISHRLLW